MKKVFLIISVAFVMLQSCMPSKDHTVNVIPNPNHLSAGDGSFVINNETRLLIEDDNIDARVTAQIFKDQLRLISGINPEMGKYDERTSENAIVFGIDNELQKNLGNEGYTLEVDKHRILINGSDASGLFYGLQTLYQLMPAGIYGDDRSVKAETIELPCVNILDRPAYSWRGMHLDVSRHFFPKEFIKRYIDLIAMHKMNVFHWHLTDDNGWRIEIKEYPKLTEISAWRVDREEEGWRNATPPKPGEEATYGGFYTQEEIREVIKYAEEKHITIIPEIELPGHTSEVFAAYPELSCRGEKLYVQPGSYWPNEDIFCAGKEETFEFLENVLKEVAELFPAEYIHIGGDEANKTRWEECKKCQKRIKDEGLENEEELQSYFIKRIEKYLNSLGKKLIGWDEILEGGLAPEATVMSWRGFDGGIEAAEQGHDVIMCPVSHCYFDYYQADPEFQPLAIGGFTTLKEVYDFNPTPPVLDSEQAKHILGAQGNVWTEFIPTPEHAEYMAVPRMTALAEAIWTKTENKDWTCFQHRLQQQFKRFDAMGVNYCEGSYRVNIVPMFNYRQHKYEVMLESEILDAEIYYTIDGSEPDMNSLKYEKEIEVNTETTIKAVIFRDGKMMEKPSEQHIYIHDGIGGKVTYETEPDYKYSGTGSTPLINGVFGSINHGDGQWQAFQGDDLSVIVDFETVISIKGISINFLQKQRSWIFLPVEVKCYVSDDGEEFREVGVIIEETTESKEIITKQYPFSFEDPLIARYLKIEARNLGVLPEWHWGKGGKAWLFVDEITVN